MSTPPLNEPSGLVPETEALIDVVRDEFGRVAYTHKANQKMVDRLNRRILLEKRINAALLTLTAGNTVAVVLTDERAAELTALGLTAAVLLLTVYGLSRARERLVEQHRSTAQAMWVLRERYLHLIGDLVSGAISVAEGRETRNTLTEATSVVYASAPDTDSQAYEAAQRALKRQEELTFAAWEIDVMLPPRLRSAPLPEPTAVSTPVSPWRARLARLIGGQ